MVVVKIPGGPIGRDAMEGIPSWFQGKPNWSRPTRFRWTGFRNPWASKAPALPRIASGVDDVTAARGRAAIDAITPPKAPPIPQAGRTQFTATQKTLLIGGGTAVIGGATAPIWLGGFGKGAEQASKGTEQFVQAPLSGAGSGLADLFGGLGSGLANLFAGAGAGTGVGLGTGLAATGEGLRRIAGPALLLGGAAILAIVVLNRNPPRRRR